MDCGVEQLLGRQDVWKAVAALVPNLEGTTPVLIAGAMSLLVQVGNCACPLVFIFMAASCHIHIPIVLPKVWSDVARPAEVPGRYRRDG